MKDRDDIAHELAFWHGQKMAIHVRGEGMFSVANLHGYEGPDGHTRYADTHWRRYTSAADRVIEMINAEVQASLNGDGC